MEALREYGIWGVASVVGVAQLVERRSVAPNVAGSNPVSHPNFQKTDGSMLPGICRLASEGHLSAFPGWSSVR